jgi:hypothetical protein
MKFLYRYSFGFELEVVLKPSVWIEEKNEKILEDIHGQLVTAIGNLNL